MISKCAYMYCRDDLSLIENYEKAISDESQVWDCHHRLEVQDDKILSKDDLIGLNLYYNRPASELIFMTKKDHHSLHSSNLKEETLRKRSLKLKGKCNPMYGKNFTKEHKEKLSESHLGNIPWNAGKKLDSDKMKWYHNDVENIRCEVCPEGFVPGRLSYKVDLCNLSKITKGTIWCNNGIKNIRVKECPEGFVPGRLSLSDDHGKRISEANTGIKYWNNGEIVVKSFECPEGFVHGMLHKWYNNGITEIKAKCCPDGFVSGRLKK
jgi:hypothetical protein